MTGRPPSVRPQDCRDRVGLLRLLALSLWCGLTAGLLEVVARVVCRAIDPISRLYMMTRHFVWLTPLANVLIFFGVAWILAGVVRLWPRRGEWLGVRLLFALTIVPMLMVIAPQVYPEAWLILALGIVSRSIPWLQRRRTKLRLVLAWSFPGLVGLVAILAASDFGTEWIKHRRAAGHSLPAPGSPNVLFIVLDTVRADHLSLYGYRRPTTPVLERLAKWGIRFDAARAPAPWTLPSHASFFTGRLPHELGVEWLTPLRSNFPMLAEYLGFHGYATAGFVANTGYCSYDTGLDRGFIQYEDYILKKLDFFRTSILVETTVRSVLLADQRTDVRPVHATGEFVRRWFYAGDRKDAGSINRSFLDWLARRPESRRPFFVFLNYLDAHAPYKLPKEAQPRFGRKPQTDDELRVIYDRWNLIDKLTLPGHFLTLARDSYDNGLVYLDERLGTLFDELQRRGVLEQTLVIITSDHGEGMGEHDLFDHGQSLYSTEINVPLLIIPPANRRIERVVRDVVSLRDLPATVVDLLGLGAGSPFPGRSLAELWRHSASKVARAAVDEVVSELGSPNPANPNHGRSPAVRGPMISLSDGDFVYIRNEGDGTEELFSERDDPHQLTNRAGSDALKPILERFRENLTRIKPGAYGAAR
jgi:arylsulfatase A-like enzyme